MDVGIVGGSGYGGGELLRLLAAHPALKVRAVAAGGASGRDLAAVSPQLGRGGQLVPATPDALAGCELVLLATPDDVSLALAPALRAAGSAVIDLSAAFRLGAEGWTAWYGGIHPAPELVPAPYGLPELFRDELTGAGLVANPGCYATAALLALAPLAGMVDAASVVVSGLSGTSGAGKGLREDLHASHVLGNMAPYASPGHRHTGEIEQAWRRLTGTPARVTFTPHLVPLSRGLLCTAVADLACDASAAAVREAYADAYDGETFVTLLEEGTWPQTAYVRGANTAHVAVAVDARTRRVTAACAIDNLGKGAAGQALQNANLVAGLPEATGLPTAALYP